MNYLEIAEAYDKQADLMMSLISDSSDLKNQTCVAAVLEARERAEELRIAVAKRAADVEYREFEFKLRKAFFDLEQRNVEARVQQANAFSKMAGAYERLEAALDRILSQNDGRARQAP